MMHSEMSINEYVNQFCHDYPEDIRERIRADMLILTNEIYKINEKGLTEILNNTNCDTCWAVIRDYKKFNGGIHHE